MEVKVVYSDFMEEENENESVPIAQLGEKEKLCCEIVKEFLQIKEGIASCNNVINC